MAETDDQLEEELYALLQARGLRVGGGDLHGVLLEEAYRAADRALDAACATQKRAELGASAAAILCASAACEAYVSEYLAHHEFKCGPLAPELEKVRGERSGLAQWRVLSQWFAPDLRLGTTPEYQRLACLMKVRDLVAHRNARLRQVGEIPPQLEPFVRQGILPVRNSLGPDWTERVLVSEVAAWSAGTAESWLKLFDGTAPRRC